MNVAAIEPIVVPGSAPPAGHYSAGVRHGGLVYVSGQLGVRPDGTHTADQPFEVQVRAMLGEQLTLPDPVWNKVTISWIVFFLFMGILNLIVAFNFPTDIWVNFKLFGGMGLLLLFVLGQGLMLSKYVEDKQ